VVPFTFWFRETAAPPVPGSILYILYIPPSEIDHESRRNRPLIFLLGVVPDDQKRFMEGCPTYPLFHQQVSSENVDGDFYG
jgi:hypothetical protein